MTQFEHLYVLINPGGDPKIRFLGRTFTTLSVVFPPGTEPGMKYKGGNLSMRAAELAKIIEIRS
jgi:hypothetical protein